MSVPEIIALKYSNEYISGFKKGYFDETGSKLFAYSILSVDDDNFKSISPDLINKGYGYSPLDLSGKKYIIETTDGSYTNKPFEQLVEEGTFKFLALKFYGVFYESDWYILGERDFFELNSENNIADKLDKVVQAPGFWLNGLFETVPKMRLEIDYKAAAEMLSRETNREIDVMKDWWLVSDYLKKFPRGEAPKREMPQWYKHREFVGLPWLVAYEKEDAKDRVNRCYESFINEEIVIPLVKNLKLNRPEEFHKTYTFSHPTNYPLIYPQSKQYVIFIVKAQNSTGSSRLFYFLYIQKEKQIFQWMFPKPRFSREWHGWCIAEDIENLSYWGNDFSLQEPEITMEDENFWAEYVFKKEDGEFLYLKPIEVKNPQPDIYTQW